MTGLGKPNGKNIRVEDLALTQSTIQDVTVGIVCCFIRGDMPQLFETLDQRVITRDRFHTSVRIDKVGAAIPDVRNRDLLTKHKRGGQCRSTARRLTLDG